MKLRRKPAFYCHGCGAALTQEQLEAGRAVRRAGQIYCRACFRKEFPGECRNHPGRKADAKCAMCGVPYCGDCLVEIAGKKVCERCKGAVLSMIEKGEDPLKPGALTISKRPWEKKLPRELREKAARVLPRRFYIPIAVDAVIIALLFRYMRGLSLFPSMATMIFLPATILFVYWLVNTSYQVRIVEVNKQGVTGVTAGVSELELLWEDISSVAIGKREIVVRGKGPVIRIRKSMFARYYLIGDVIREFCREKDIKCTR